jgi:DNA-binding NarL/FixJ family response regulator
MNEWHEYLERRDAKIVELYESGLSLREVARRVDLTPSTVENDLERMGVERRPVGRPRREAVDA